MAKRRHGREPDIVRITTAPVSRQADLHHREVRYVISMTIRTLCFVGAIVAGLVFGVDWLMWVLIAASFLLPYIAVVMANTASPMVEDPDLEPPGQQFPELEGRPDRKDR